MVHLPVGNIQKEFHTGLTTCVCPFLGQLHAGCNPPDWETVRKIAVRKAEEAKANPPKPRPPIPDDIPVTQ